MMAAYCSQARKFPDSSMPMFNEIQSIALSLIKMAEDNKLNMNDILNWAANDGQTLFWNATMFSELLANELLKRNVAVKRVDYLFQVPSFRVS